MKLVWYSFPDSCYDFGEYLGENIKIYTIILVTRWENYYNIGNTSGMGRSCIQYITQGHYKIILYTVEICELV